MSLIAASILFFSPFIPLIFQGEEWACNAPFQYFVNHSDTELCKAVSEGRRKEFENFEEFKNKIDTIPDPADYKTFENSTLDWQSLSDQHHIDYLGSYKDLIEINRTIHGDEKKELGGFIGKEIVKDELYSISYGEFTLLINKSSNEHTLTDTGLVVLLPKKKSGEKSPFTIPKQSFLIIKNPHN